MGRLRKSVPGFWCAVVLVLRPPAFGTETLETLRQRAEQGVADAQLRLGERYGNL